MSVVSPGLLAAPLVVAALVLAGCGHEDDGQHVTRDPDGPAQYVALGDSYTSAPGVPDTVDVGCYRSNRNYPTLVADELDLNLTDVSCGGATTTSLSDVQQTPTGGVPPQFEALTEHTRLVTVGIGANDDGLFGSLLTTCMELGRQPGDGSPCRDAMNKDGSDQLLESIDDIQSRLSSALLDLQDRAPNAEVVLVGYPQPVPDRVRCSALPLAAGDYAYVREIFVALAKATEGAADRTGIEYIDLLSASDGHDMCAGDEAWLTGVTTGPDDETVPMHPKPEEQEAVAELVVAALDD